MGQGISRHLRTWIPSCHRYVGNNDLTLYTCFFGTGHALRPKKHVCHYICLSYLYRNHSLFLLVHPVTKASYQATFGFVPAPYLEYTPPTYPVVMGRPFRPLEGWNTHLWLRERGKNHEKTQLGDEFFDATFIFLVILVWHQLFCAKRMKPLFALRCFQRTMWPDLVIDGERWIIVRCFFFCDWIIWSFDCSVYSFVYYLASLGDQSIFLWSCYPFRPAKVDPTP